MEMVSASKMRRAQRNALATRPYAERMRDVMGELTARAAARAWRIRCWSSARTVRRVGLIVITPDRGCAAR